MKTLYTLVNLYSITCKTCSVLPAKYVVYCLESMQYIALKIE